MKRTLVYILLSAAFLAAPGFLMKAQPKTKLNPSQTILLYPEGQKVDMGLAGTLGPQESNGITDPEMTDKNGWIWNISDKARVDLYFPKRGNGQLVVICPGGGYQFVSSYNEGIYVAEWLVSQGIAAAVVKYRLPNGHSNIPLTDVQNALRYCRANADDWKIKSIGIMGFSAGGHLAASASNLFTDDITRPDFSILIYPVISMDKTITHMGSRNSLVGKDKKAESLFSLENQVTRKTPPTFIVHCSDDDTVPVANSAIYYAQLAKNHVYSEMHIYPTGGHGWGFTTKGRDGLGYARKEFEEALLRWLKSVR
jgi:acetyl esterase/lipase